MGVPDSRRGAYGFVVRAPIDIPAELLIEAPAGWPDWTFEISVADENAHDATAEVAVHIDGDHAEIQFASDGSVTIDRLRSVSHLRLTKPMSAHEFVHPFLSSTGAITAWWNGHIALHGSCAALNGSGVGFLGARGQGKSTTLMWMLEHGWQAVTDDLMIIAGTSVMAGPRVVDLRRETALAWQRGHHVGQLGTRRRWREVAAPVEAATPLAGLVQLEWGERLEVVEVPLADKIEILYRNRTLDIPPRSAGGLLNLLGIPLLRLIRPRDLDGVGRAVAAVREALAIG